MVRALELCSASDAHVMHPKRNAHLLRAVTGKRLDVSVDKVLGVVSTQKRCASSPAATSPCSRTFMGRSSVSSSR